MLNIVMPIAGRGSRFVEAGFSEPKPLIPVHSVPMVQVAVNNIRPKQPHQFIFVALKEHLETTNMGAVLRRIAPGCIVISVASVTEGAACTVLLAKDFIDTPEPLMIANSDQWVDADIGDYVATLEREDADGLIMTMWADDPKWSYVELDPRNNVKRVVEKQVISNEATVGIYNFRSGRAFVQAAEEMIAKNLRVNNEFYVAPVYNQMIARSAKVRVYNVGKEDAGMYGMGTPADLQKFAQRPISMRAIAG